MSDTQVYSPPPQQLPSQQRKPLPKPRKLLNDNPPVQETDKQSSAIAQLQPLECEDDKRFNIYSPNAKPCKFESH